MRDGTKVGYSVIDEGLPTQHIYVNRTQKETITKAVEQISETFKGINFHEFIKVIEDTDKEMKETMARVNCEQVWHRGGPSDFSRRGGKGNVKFKSR